MDCGVAPGMGNIIFSYHDQSMQISDYECLVGGLPKNREWPFEYKAVFSPVDVIEEYTRPARYVHNSQLVVKEALSETELIDFDGVGSGEVSIGSSLTSGTVVSSLSLLLGDKNDLSALTIFEKTKY